MSSSPVQTIYVLSSSNGLADHVRRKLKNLDLDIEVKDIPEKEIHSLQDDEVEFAVGQIRQLVAILSRETNKIKWIQCTSAGVDHIFKNIDHIKPQKDFIMTRTASLDRGQMMGEYCIGHIIARERGFQIWTEAQRRADYDRKAAPSFRMLRDLTVGFLGVGSLGGEIARMCRAVGMSVWAGVTDRRFESGASPSQEFDHVIPMSRLDDLLGQCDYVVATLPSTPETRGLLSGDVLQACKVKQTVLINLGRGDLIDDLSLIKAISNGWLGGAILDVLDQEPLPPDNPLWSLPNVTITPHISCQAKNSLDIVAENYVDNVLRYLRGERLQNYVDFNKGY
ncbi:glyoxylate/hydroxypyruvate reductase A [Biomphalaria glabrata]|nr:glyoxylate/hydroxypyruvate reductase A [Biomphalaria glabrata]